MNKYRALFAIIIFITLSMVVVTSVAKEPGRSDRFDRVRGPAGKEDSGSKKNPSDKEDSSDRKDSEDRSRNANNGWAAWSGSTMNLYWTTSASHDGYDVLRSSSGAPGTYSQINVPLAHGYFADTTIPSTGVYFYQIEWVDGMDSGFWTSMVGVAY